jgi:hypothetical protein
MGLNVGWETRHPAAHIGSMASLRVGGFNVLTTALSTEASCHRRGLLLSATLADAAAGRPVLLVHHHRLEVRWQHAVLPPAPSIQ